MCRHAVCLQDSTAGSKVSVAFTDRTGEGGHLSHPGGKSLPILLTGLTSMPPAGVYIEEDFHVLEWVHSFLEPSCGTSSL